MFIFLILLPNIDCRDSLKPVLNKGDISVVVLIVLCLDVYFFVLLVPYVCYHI